MKRYILILAALLTVGRLAAAPQFLLKGLDLTGQSTVTAAQLNQMIDNAVPTNWVGFVIRTNGRPSTAVFTGYTNFLWLDTTANPPSLKSYVCCGDADTNWVTATISGASIGTAQLASPAVNVGQIYSSAVVSSNIAVGAVTDSKINDGAVNTNKIAGASVSSYHIFDGTITGGDIATLTITDTNIASGTLTGGKLVNNTIAPSKLATGTPGYFLAQPSAGGDVAFVNFFAAYVTNSVPMPTTTDTITNTHTLGAVPSVMQLSIVCQTPELGYNAGDEVTIESIMVTGSDRPYFTVSADASKWYLVTPAGTADAQIRTRTNTFAFQSITDANWRIAARFYRFTAP